MIQFINHLKLKVFMVLNNGHMRNYQSHFRVDIFYHQSNLVISYSFHNFLFGDFGF